MHKDCPLTRLTVEAMLIFIHAQEVGRTAVDLPKRALTN